MSKIICDICGTSYADTAIQCPICGCVRPAQPQPVPEGENQSSGYTYVKGGRFSKSNVKKRTSGNNKPPKEEKEDKKRPVALLIVIILIGVACLGAILWATGVFDMFTAGDDGGIAATTPAPTVPNNPVDIPCEAITVAKKQYTLEKIGDAVLLDCRKLPTDSTDVMTFISENEEVATVDANGKVTAVENGKTKVIITCGSVTDTCEIIVGNGIYPVDLVLDYSELEFTATGEWKDLYSGPIPLDKITWTSSNEVIAPVNNGRVTALMSGEVVITAVYLDKTATCRITCNIEPTGNGGGITEDGGTTGNGGGITEDGGNTGSGSGITEDGENATYELYASFGPLYYGNDITVSEGSEFTLYLKSSTGKLIDVDWTCRENEHVSTDGGKIKAIKRLYNDYITVTTMYENVSYSCKIRVS